MAKKKKKGDEKRAHFSNNLDIRCTGSILRCNGLDHTNNVALHHAHIVDMAVLLGKFKKVLYEVHDVGPGVDGRLGVGGMSG